MHVWLDLVGSMTAQAEPTMAAQGGDGRVGGGAATVAAAIAAAVAATVAQADDGRGGVHHRGGHHGLLDDLRVHGVAADGDDGVEAVVLVGGVVHGALGAVGLDEGVLALHHVAVADLLLVLDVSGVAVLDAVGELVLGVSLWWRIRLASSGSILS